MAIRNRPRIRGVFCGSLEHTCALFADDLHLFVTSPLISIPNLFKLLHDFGLASGLQVNMSKSRALNITVFPLPDRAFTDPFLVLLEFQFHALFRSALSTQQKTICTRSTTLPSTKS